MDRDIWMYHGIAELNAPHRQMQWGGACLFKNGFDQMPDGRARFSPLTPDEAVIPAGQFRLSSRRGWGQWNSQHRTNVQKDSLTPASSKRSVLMNPADAESLDLKPGDAVALTNPQGQDYIGFCRPDDAQQARHVQVFWPASNDIIPSGIYDDASKEPDYNVLVTIRKSTQSPAELSHVHAD
jgi:anaerobic selenocysteine-containing dehydrogenase